MGHCHFLPNPCLFVTHDYFIASHLQACQTMNQIIVSVKQQIGRSGDRIPVGARFSVPVQTGPGAHPASCTMGTGSFPGVKSGRGLTLIPHPLLAPWSRKGRAIPLLPLWAVRPVQSLSACTRVHFTFYLKQQII
jgi:DNA-binding transcriptional LysR family regulator